MTEVLKIEDETELEAWLKDKPVEWAQVVATRCAMRVFPLVFSISRISDNRYSLDRKQKLILSVWRANFVSWSVGKYPAYDLKLASASASEAAFAASVEASNSADSASTGRLSAASDAAFADATIAASAARASGYAAVSALGADSSFSGAAASVAYSADSVWKAVITDLHFLVEQKNLKNAAIKLVSMPLWFEPIAESEGYQTNSPEISWKMFDQFANLYWVRNNLWQLITDWYVANLPNDRRSNPRSLFGKSADIEIAMQPKEFWERDPNEVMAAIAEIVKKGSDDKPRTIPSQHPASVRPRWVDNRVTQDSSPLAAISGDELGLASLQSLREEMRDLAKSIKAEQNIDARPGSYIADTADLISDSLPSSAALLRLVRREAMLREYLDVVEEQWPDFLVGRYKSALRDLSEALDQFEDRRRFARVLLEIDLEDLHSEDAASETEAIVAEMRSEPSSKIIDSSIPVVIESIGDKGDSESLPGSEVAKIKNVDQLESVNNTFKRLAERAEDDPKYRDLMRRMDEAYLDEFQKNLLEGAREAGKSDGKNVGKGIMRAKVGASAAKFGGKKLSERYPRFFGWLARYTK